MDKQEERELNERLARWVGFTRYITDPWEDSEGRYHNQLPDYTQDLTACFHPEWGIARKLPCVRIEYASGWSHIYLEKGGNSTEFVGEVEPALALCLAVDKLGKESQV